jgi:hypothetical protein
MLAHVALAWLLTSLLHSTLLLGLAWLASKPLARWSVAAEETMWRLALAGGLLTASLQLAAGWEPPAGRWRLTDASPAASATMDRTAKTDRTPTGAALPAPRAPLGPLASGLLETSPSPLTCSAVALILLAVTAAEC